MLRLTALISSFLIALMALTLPAAAQQIQRVTTPAELRAALQAVPAGGWIDLAPGDYGTLKIVGLTLSGGKHLTLRSEDAASPARFSGMTLSKVGNITLENVVFDYDARSGHALFHKPFRVLQSTGVTISGARFIGDLARGRSNIDDGYATGFGLFVRHSSDVTIKGNDISVFHRGLVVRDSSDVSVRGNNIYHIRMDGMAFTQMRDLRIEGNYIHDFRRAPKSADHADMIQFWTKGTKIPSQDIVIRGNILSSGKGLYTQSIFMRNEEVDQGRAGPEMFYRNVRIENNMIINGQLHGISIGETDRLVIRNNTVVRNNASAGKGGRAVRWTPQIRVAEAAARVQITHNVTSEVSGYARQKDWTVGRNFMVQNVIGAGPGFYGTVFGLAALENPTSPASFKPAKGGPLDNTGIGASLSLPQ